ncbi:MAG: transcription termination factor Rho, partial [Rhodopirellula bahusiensis]
MEPSSTPGPARNARRSNRRMRHPDKDVDKRVRELDAERDPLSLPEEIVSEVTRAGGRVGIPAKDQPPKQALNINDLQKLEHD